MEIIIIIILIVVLVALTAIGSVVCGPDNSGVINEDVEAARKLRKERRHYFTK